MGLYEISQAKILAFFVNIVILLLGHCLLLNRASLPWRGTKPIRHKETCPGFLMRPQFTEHIRGVYPERSEGLSVNSVNVNCMAELILKMRQVGASEGSIALPKPKSEGGYRFKIC